MQKRRERTTRKRSKRDAVRGKRGEQARREKMGDDLKERGGLERRGEERGRGQIKKE